MSDTVQCAPPVASTRLEEPSVPGEPGLWVFLFGDLVLFAFLFGAYLQARLSDRTLFAGAHSALDVDVGVVNTVLLLTSSLFVVWALAASRAGRHRRAGGWVLAAAACGSAFGVLKVVEYHAHVVHGDGPHANAFFLWYFILTGAHLAHLVIGLGLLACLFSAVRRSTGPPVDSGRLVEGCACFWHLVDLLWIVLFPLLYLVA